MCTQTHTHTHMHSIYYVYAHVLYACNGMALISELNLSLNEFLDSTLPVYLLSHISLYHKIER